MVFLYVDRAEPDTTAIEVTVMPDSLGLAVSTPPDSRGFILTGFLHLV
jgi:hypothetical protein